MFCFGLWKNDSILKAYVNNALMCDCGISWSYSHRLLCLCYVVSINSSYIFAINFVIITISCVDQIILVYKFC